MLNGHVHTALGKRRVGVTGVGAGFAGFAGHRTRDEIPTREGIYRKPGGRTTRNPDTPLRVPAVVFYERLTHEWTVGVELADQLLISRPRMVAAVRELKAAGLIESRPGPRVGAPQEYRRVL